MTTKQVSTIAAPFNEEAEKATIGSVLLDPFCFLDVASQIKAGDFFLLRHNIIWQAIERLQQEQSPIEPITIADRLEATKELDLIGGRAYLIDLTMSVGTSIHAYAYAKIVKRMAIRRKMIVALDEMRKLAFDDKLALPEVQNKADALWLHATSDSTEAQGAWLADSISKLYDEVEMLMHNRKPFAGIPTGLRDLDNLMCGIEPDTLTIIAGRPGMGKSALMDNIALNMAKAGNPIYFASSERSVDQVTRRMASIITGIDSRKFKTGQLSAQEVAVFTAAVGTIAELPIYIDDKPMPTPRDIIHQAKWMVERHGAKAILFDGMYRARTGVREYDNDNQRKYGEIALQLKTISRTLCPVVATHQLNRAIEQRQDKRPKMADLRESGRIEEEADKILFLYRDGYYNPATEFPNQCDLILEKHRDGSTGTVTTYFEDSCTRFLDATIHRVDLSDLGD